MKQVVQGVFLFAIALLTVLSVMVVSGRNRSEKDLTEALSTTLSETLENMAVSGVYSIRDTEEFKADFTELFIDQLNLDPVSVKDDGEGVSIEEDSLTLRIDFAVADPKKEVLMVHVLERVAYPNGSDALIEDSAAVIFNEESEYREYAVSYLIEEEEIESRGLMTETEYHSYEEEEGQCFQAPTDPSDENGNLHPVRWICIKAPEDGKEHRIKPYEESKRKYTAEELRTMEIDGDYVFQAEFVRSGA